MDLNIEKAVAIPLWPEGVQETLEHIAVEIPSWSRLSVQTHGTYLGFVEGPGKGNKSWDKPVSKYMERTKRWGQVGIGMQYAALTYNTFAITTLMYVGQLERPPPKHTTLEQRGLVSMLPGPGHWILPNDACYLKRRIWPKQVFRSNGRFYVFGTVQTCGIRVQVRQ